MDTEEREEIARIAELKNKLDQAKQKHARRFHAPDDDPTVVYVMVEDVGGGGEQFLRSTVSATLAGCHSNWSNRDTFMETGERQVRAARVKMIEVIEPIAE